jgi:hypothetical protein
MTPYFRAYLLGDLRRFPGWAQAVRPGEQELTDESVVYLREDYAVVRDPIQPDQGVLWDVTTPQWREFCSTSLGFAPLVPDDRSVGT